MSKFFRSCSSKHGGHALDGEEYVEKGDDLITWKMPKIPTNKIYTTKRFSLSSDPFIKTLESRFSFGNHGGFVRLFSQTPSSYCERLNVGMVQIGVKTLTRKLPAAASIVLCLRDNRISHLPDAILGMVETKLSDGPFYFNIFPNVNLSMSSPYMIDVLSLNVLLSGLEQIPADSDPVLMTCRACYRLNESNFGAEALLESPTGRTVFYQTEIDEDGNGVVQKVTKWDEVNVPADWPPQLKRKTAKMVQNSNGSVEVSFS